MKTFKEALNTFFTTGKKETPESFHDEKRYEEILKNLDIEFSKMYALAGMTGQQASS